MKKMRTSLRAAAISALVAFCAYASHAANSIVADTLKRSTGAPESPVDASVNNAALEAAPESAQAGADLSKVEIGVIKSLSIGGAVDFANDEGARDFLERALIDGKVKTIKDLQTAINDCLADLCSRGFYLASVYPASANAYNSETGELALIVDSGKFGDVQVDLVERDSWHWFSREQVAKRLKGIDRNETFNYFRLRSAIADLNGHPDLLANTKISLRETAEGDKPDSPYTRFADVSLEVEDSFPLHLIWDVNNYGMEEIDDWQTSLTVQYLNLTRNDDVLTFTPATSFNQDLFSVTASYMLPIDFLLGMNLTVYGGYSDLDSDDLLPKLALEGIGYFYGVNWSANLYDDDKRNFAFNLGVMYRYLEDEWSVAAYKLNKREAGILPVTAGYSYADKKGDWLGGRDFVNVGLTFNLASTEDDLDMYTTHAEEHYWILRGGWQRLQPLFGENLPDDQKWRAWSIYIRIEGQYSDDVLLSAERLAYGGYNCLRGYRTRGYLGDTGVYGTAELRTPVLCDLLAGVVSDRTGKSPFDRLQFLGFVDAGWIKYNDPDPRMEDTEFLCSAGVGIRAGLTKYTSLNCDFAFPLKNAYAHDEDDDFEFYLSVKVQW